MIIEKYQVSAVPVKRFAHAGNSVTPEEKAAARKKVMSLLGFAAVVGSISDYSEMKKRER